MHLRTPISGRLKAGASPTALVRAMHPTAALGGTPRDTAMRFIAANEGDLRGWYGSPLGWIDADGNLEFAVALRSALVRGSHAVLYAGAGIVRGSTPERELAETDAKLFAMRELLRQLENG
jgi:isochorismate synthase EntC